VLRSTCKKLWFDAEADFREVRFSDAAGYERQTNHDAVMERVDAQGHVIGFSVLGVSKFKKDKPLEADLLPA
jgi:cytochrome oxidase Cu insertion factor (SCO1/SenC/PrrC family)